MVGWGTVGQGMDSKVRLGKFRHGWSGNGLVRNGLVRLGLVCCGEDGFGMVYLERSVQLRNG